MTEAARPGRRTRLSPEREAELYDVVLELLGEVGYDGLTMPAVAARARCSTATIYRQWQGKPGLVLAALRRLTPPPLTGADIDTGTLRGDLREFCHRISRAPVQHQIIAALAHTALRDPDLAAALRDHFRLREISRHILRRAAERGEIPGDTPAAEFIPAFPMALFIAHLMVEGREAEEEYLHRFIDIVLIPALTTPRKP